MKQGARIWLFRILTAVAVPLLLVGLVEAGLRLSGYGYSSAYTLPCKVQGQDAYCNNDKFTWQFFPPGAFRLPHSFAIPARKAEGTFRIFIVGESAAQGVPEPSYAFGRYLEAMLRERFPATRFEVINTSISSINSHVLLPITRDLARHEPDLFIMYIGNNEVVGPYGPGTTLTRQGSSLALIRASIFLKSLRLGQLASAALHGGGDAKAVEWRGMRMFLEQQISADAPQMKRLYANFRANLEDIVATARASGAPVLISTVGVNLKDSAPFGSLHRAALSEDDRKTWELRVGEGSALVEAGRPVEALQHLLAAAAIDDRHAELQYRIASCRYALGDFTAAREGYARARDLDSLRFRADGPINGVIRTVAAAAGQGVDLVDGEAVFAAGSPHETVGRELFNEHVHMTPQGNYLLAKELFPRVVAALPDAVKKPSQTAEVLTREESDRVLALTAFDRLRVAKKVIEWLSQPPFTNQLNHAAQVAVFQDELSSGRDDPQQTDATYRWALERAPMDRWLHFNYGVFLKDRDPAAAVDQFRAAIDLLPSNHEARELLADALVTMGSFNEALDEIHELLNRMPYHAPAHLTMAYALAQTGSFDKSIAAYERAVELNPSYASAAYNQIGVIQLHQRRYDRAAASFQKALDLSKDPTRNAELQANLKLALVEQRRQAAQQRAPDSSVAR